MVRQSSDLVERVLPFMFDMKSVAGTMVIEGESQYFYTLELYNQGNKGNKY